MAVVRCNPGRGAGAELARGRPLDADATRGAGMVSGSCLAVPCEAGAQARRAGHRPDGDGCRAAPAARHPGHRTARL